MFFDPEIELQASGAGPRGSSAPASSRPQSVSRRFVGDPSRLDERAAGVVHDLRNLLAVAVSGTNLLRTPTETARSNGIIDAIQQALHGVDKLATSLAGVGRHPVARPGWVDVGAVLARQATLYLGDLPRDIWLRIETSSRLPLVWLDQAMLESALLNLVLNAKEAMPEGGCLTIRAKRLPRHVRLIVADSGVGMDPGTLRAVGSPFFTRKPGKGNGLGVAQVRRFVRQSGGHMAVRSRPGRGTVFILDLPA